MKKHFSPEPREEIGPLETTSHRRRDVHHTSAGAARKPYGRRDTEYFRGILLNMREEILNDLRTYKETLRTLADNLTGDTYDDDVAVQLNTSIEASSVEELANLSDRQEKLLSHVDAALNRIKNGRYGLCRSCSRRIPQERLEAVPHATLCHMCKTGRAA
jgi:RNA polymerase-binding protein DksA